MKRALFILICLLIFIGLCYGQAHFLGAYIEPKLEKKMTEIFGMEITIRDLRVNLLTGNASASYVEFRNQPEYLDDPHTRVEGLKVKMDVFDLFDRKVTIHRVDLYKPFYFIDRISDADGPRTNITTYRRHMKSRKKPKDPNETPKPKWLVDIREIYLTQGTFLFYDRSAEIEKKIKVSDIEGELLGFRWPEDPDQMPQRVRVKAMYGVDYPAPIDISGKANFSSSQVSFDLDGEVLDGDLMEYRSFFEDMSLELLEGRFYLKTHTRCIKRELDSINQLILRKLDVKAKGDNVATKFWGAPTVAAIAFMEDQMQIELDVGVKGNITDAHFGFGKAFRKAFGESFGKRIRSGLQSIRGGADKLVKGTQTIAKKTPTKLAEGLGKLKEVVTETVPQATKQAVEGSKELIKTVEA